MENVDNETQEIWSEMQADGVLDEATAKQAGMESPLEE